MTYTGKDKKSVGEFSFKLEAPNGQWGVSIIELDKEGKFEEKTNAIVNRETFIASTSEGCDMVHLARTKMIQDVYASNPPEGLEELVGAKLVNLFSDMKIKENIAVSVFVFDKNII